MGGDEYVGVHEGWEVGLGEIQVSGRNEMTEAGIGNNIIDNS